jgi:hypothetical protein
MIIGYLFNMVLLFVNKLILLHSSLILLIIPESHYHAKSGQHNLEIL